ncbi:hypothetical protein [Legionella fallonii]|uniref:Putative membrane protein n=1 Tax=Legionella fallonii LLAP-10 TaxID=1212491 RepID=A0A098G8W8_9GAMM|nr:hypothetical protein [Legionella fallonii]CEG58411.1 putative membrane protein [Legionella fallonii LLAP-10]
MITDDQKCYKTTLTHIYWTAILAGAFVGVGLGFLLNIFSMAIGLSAYTATANGATAIAIGGILGLLIGVIAAMGTAGFVAGYLGRFYHCYCHGGVLYGFITWSIALMLSAILLVPIAHYVDFYEENLNPALTAPTEVSNTKMSDTDVSASASEQKVTSQQTLNMSSKHLAWSGWILFILFFIGALSSCIGACYGMRCKREEQNISSPS